MELRTYAQIDSNGKVINCILWDGLTEFALSGELIEYTTDNPAYIGGSYVDGVFYPAPETPQEP